MYRLTTQRQVRAAFWLLCEGQYRKYRGKRQNDYPADVRMAFVDFVDHLQKEGRISEALADRVTL